MLPRAAQIRWPRVAAAGMGRLAAAGPQVGEGWVVALVRVTEVVGVGERAVEDVREAEKKWDGLAGAVAAAVMAEVVKAAVWAAAAAAEA